MAEGNRSSGAIDLITNLAPLLLGTGKQTTSTSNTASKQGLDPKTSAMLQSLISGKEYSKGAAVSDTQGAMENAMKLMMQSGMPDISNALHAQGAYNSSTNNLLTNDLMSRAAGAGAQIQLDQINKYSDTRANAAATLKDANTTTTTAQKSTAKTAPVVSPWLTGGAMLGGTLLSHLLDGFGSSNKKRLGDSNEQSNYYTAPMHFDTNGGGGLSSMLQGAFSSPESGMGGITRAIEGAFSNFGGSGKSGGSSSSGFSGGTGLLGGLLSGIFGSGGGSSIAAPNSNTFSDSGAPGGQASSGSTFGLGDIGNFFSNLFKF
jgi:hypothetical protein